MSDNLSVGFYMTDSKLSVLVSLQYKGRSASHKIPYPFSNAPESMTETQGDFLVLSIARAAKDYPDCDIAKSLAWLGVTPKEVVEALIEDF